MHATGVKKAALEALSSRTLDGRGLRIGICYTKWNTEIIEALRDGAVATLKAAGVAEVDIVLLSVPGAYELPYAASRMISSMGVDAVICVGCLIKGETMHFEYICEAVSQGIKDLNLNTGVPVLFGVLACLDEKQARARAGLEEGGHNHGVEWAQTAIEMAHLRRATQPASSGCCPLGFSKEGKCPMRSHWFCHATMMTIIAGSIALGMHIVNKRA
ncbi:6,7-dimethyl-8-ribityllumazine synthase [Achlya hypogyna]|uniref:6,7-dimethyl-8-ribityllumazine synthase n=1 Tax=Achlya hypogyna TaxID=1202772 RepID=A0A1V9ZUP9_ACHHY|nr:6,7-dimethyl-8-ribityllumazine synthase [Achlya hypogyna]